MVNDTSNGDPSLFSHSSPNETSCTGDYLYDTGFIQGQFSDITLIIPSLNKSYPLHSLILAQSPTLCRLLPTSYLNHAQTDAVEKIHPTIEFDFKGHEIKTVAAVLGSLYRHLSPLDIHNELDPNAPLKSMFDLLDCADLLELTILADMIQAMIRNHQLTKSSIHTWIATLRPFRDQEKPWAAQVESHIMSFLTLTLTAPRNNAIKISGRVIVGTIEAHGYMPSKISNMRLLRDLDELATIYATLPTDYLVRCLEHPGLPVQDDIQRFHFAKHVLSLRATQDKHDKHELMVTFRFEGDDKTVVAVTPRTRRKTGKWDPSRYDTS